MRDRDDQNRSGPGFNRRDFLKGSAAAATATAMATQGSEEAAAANLKTNVFAAAAQNVTLNVNGKDHTVKVEPRVTLLHVLRNNLKYLRHSALDWKNNRVPRTRLLLSG